MSDLTFQLNSGHKIPAVGLGTWLSDPKDLTNAVTKAIEIGYRHIDCAYIYQNEEAVGAGIKAALDKGFKREDLFITTKLWSTFHEYEDVKKGCQESLKKLGLDYVDLYLIHWPVALKAGQDVQPLDENGAPIATDCDYLDTWKGMEELVDAGLAKSIGISNFNISQVQRILDNCRIKPAMQQVEIHPRFRNDKLVKFCQEKGIRLTAYFSLGNNAVPERISQKTWSLLEDERVAKIAKKYGKTSAQVLLRWPIQQGICAIPKSVNEDRLKQNFDIFDFTLTDEEMEILSNFPEQERVSVIGWQSSHKYYPHVDV